MNPTMEKLFGYTVEDIPTAEHWYSLAYPDVNYRNFLVEEWVRKVQHAIETQTPIEAMESVVTCKDGSTKNMLWDFITLGNKNYAFGLDLTERKQAEEAMRLSEEYFKNIFEYSTVGKSITTLEGRLRTNNQFRQILGYSEEELSKLKWQEITHPDDVQENMDYLAAVVSGEKDSMRWEKRYIHKDGHIVWTDISTVLQRDNEGNPLYFITSIQDITERKQAELDLKNSEARYRFLFEQNPVPMLIYELGSLDLLAVNDAFVSQYGYSQSEALSLKLTDLYPEQERKAITDLSNQLHGHAYAGEWHHLKKDGTRIIIEAYSHGLSFENHDARIAVINDITERKLAEEKLHKQEEKLRVTLDNMMEGCQIIGFDWKYQYLNKAAVIQSHLQEEELLGKSFLELWPGVGETELFAGMKTCMEERITHHMENKFVFPDGTAELFDLSIQPIPEGIFILSINITERKKAEEALRESEEDYRRLFENHSAIKFIIDPETGNIHDANYAAAKYYGWSREELKTMNVSQINTLSADEVKEAMNSARKIGKEHFEFKHRKADGSIRDVEVFSNSITMKGKEYLHSIVVDITERKQAENKIIKANRIYAFISQINQTIVRVRDRDELFKESCRIAIDFGKFKMAWIGFKDEKTQVVKPVAISGNEDNYLSVIPKISFIEVPEGKGPTGSAIREGKHVVCNDIETDPRMVVWKDEALKRGYRSSIALPITLFNEVIGAFSLYAPIPNFFDDKEIALLDEVASDISYALESIETEKRRNEAEIEIITLNETLEQRVEQRTNQLEAANKELEAFSYSVSHDLRAPLRHINGFISLFMENKTTDLTEEELEYLNIVSHSAMEMGELIDALLSFSRLNRAEIQKTQIDSKQQIAQLLELFSEEFKTRKIEIKVNELPLVKGDYQLIRQVWMNLLSNAIKYTSKREVAKIEIGSVKHDAEIVFFVKDNGAGFNMKYGDKLFGVFQRLHKPRDFEGIGIGLANVNRIINRHGGRCWAEGEVDQGATFYFSLPK